jgi:hypothetical protein
MSKRYQIFVSSTYTDLRDERAKVIQALMEMDCIPSAMELFPAADEEQWQFIKKLIDDCDYYVLIIGGRYGSLASEGLSYTEKEYDYAVSRGLKVIALVHGTSHSIPASESNPSPEETEKLAAFRRKVCTGRIVKFWQKSTDLPGIVAVSLNRTIQDHPAIGWVRDGAVANYGIRQKLGLTDNVYKAFCDAGNAKRLEGTWQATWFGVDAQGSRQTYLVSDPGNPDGKVAYPAEQILLRAEGSVVFCVSQDSFKTGRDYWLGGRLSLRNELCLVYWNDSNPMGGTVFLTLTERFPFPLKLSGWWSGHSRDDEVVVGQVEWVKIG